MKNFLKNGYGKMKFSQFGCRFLGVMGLGQGIYAGFWKHDKRHSKGKMKFQDGSSFDGIWKADKKYKGTIYEQNSNLVFVMT